MCGISGIVNKDYSSVNLDEIKRINDLIEHRGPDSEGFFSEGSFSFGHRRLAILDLSEDGHQPMHYLRNYTITYNGEVYNYLEIKQILQKDGYSFKSNTDTEVILAAYDKWGYDCVKYFNGMWAFSIYDKKKQILFCSRDRFGIKPFYYSEVSEKFIFGSEIKQILEFYPERYVNKKILLDYIILDYTEHTNNTFFEGILSLNPSHNLIYDLKNNSFEIQKYYTISKRKNDYNEIESVKFYKDQLIKSILLRLRSDVKVGTCLSGGLDSSSIAALASREYNKMNTNKFSAVHAKSTSDHNDESSFAKLVSQHCDLDLHIVEPLDKDFINSIEEVVYTQEEPFGGPSVFMQYFVMQKAKEIGCTVMLDGQGGDETLLGYERYYPAYLMSLSPLKKIRGFFDSSKNSKLNFKQIILYFLYFTNSKIILKKKIRESSFIKTKYLNLISSDLVKVNSKKYLDIFALQEMEICNTQMPHLLRYEDRNSMKHSIETRLPFIDFNVLETALSTDNEYKIKSGWTKYLLRKAVEDILPKKVVWRKNKFGFEAPSKNWLDAFRNEMKSAINESIILNQITNQIEFNKLSDKQLWKLFNISIWEKVYNVKIN